METETEKKVMKRKNFTLIELLVVIAIMASQASLRHGAAAA